jgi:four helix bundle protein
VAWQKADALASATYRACRDLTPRNAWLIDQILRAAISVAANIAEGHGRGSRAELARFLDISRGSLAELEYYFHFLRQEGLVTDAKSTELEHMRLEAGKVIFGLWRSLKSMSNEDWDHTGNKVREESEAYTAFGF